MTDDIMYILIFMFKQKRRKKPVHILTVRQFRQAIRVCFFNLSENESLRFNIWDFQKQPFHSYQEFLAPQRRLAEALLPVAQESAVPGLEQAQSQRPEALE